MKIYRGYSDREDAVGGHENVVITVSDEQGTRPLLAPDECSWGYSGSGPRTLAGAILADHQGRRVEQQPGLASDEFWLADGFMRAVVGRWPQGGRWELIESEVAAWLVASLAPCSGCAAIYDVKAHPGERCPACSERDELDWTDCRCGHTRGEHLGSWGDEPLMECDVAG